MMRTVAKKMKVNAGKKLGKSMKKVTRKVKMGKKKFSKLNKK